LIWLATLPAMGAIRPWHLATLGCVGLTCVLVVVLVVVLLARRGGRP
jgi:hypothetical protein